MTVGEGVNVAVGEDVASCVMMASLFVRVTTLSGLAGLGSVLRIVLSDD